VSFKNRGRKKEHIGKSTDELNHAPEFAWKKGKFVQTTPEPQKYDQRRKQS
jgi:hypothetical protein